MSKKNTKIISILLISCLFLLPVLASAQSPFGGSVTNPYGGSVTNNGSGGQLCNPLGGCGASGPSDLAQFIQLVLRAVMKIGAVVVVFFVVYSGFLFVTAQGNEEKLKKAKNAMLWTLVGAAILLGAELLATVITNTITNISK